MVAKRESKVTGEATYDQWAAAYQQAYAAAEETVTDLACPNCGATQLHLVFVVSGQRADRGRAAFWCGNCLKGVLMAPCRVPRRAPRFTDDTAAIPNYALVPPPNRGN